MIASGIPARLTGLALAFTASACCSAAELGQSLGNYLDNAEHVVAALEDGQAPVSQQKPLQAMSDIAADMIPSFSQRFPDCGEYLGAAMGLRSSWSSLSIEAIERDYHHDAALPKPRQDGNHALCYQMKDLLVHPLTALRLLQEKPVNIDTLKHEVVEVIAHGRALSALLR